MELTRVQARLFIRIIKDTLMGKLVWIARKGKRRKGVWNDAASSNPDKHSIIYRKVLTANQRGLALTFMFWKDAGEWHSDFKFELKVKQKGKTQRYWFENAASVSDSSEAGHEVLEWLHEAISTRQDYLEKVKELEEGLAEESEVRVGDIKQCIRKRKIPSTTIQRSRLRRSVR